EAPGAQRLAGGEGRQVAPLLLRRPEGRDVVGTERVVCPHRDADRRIAAAQLLDDQRVRHVVQAGAAELLGHHDAEKAERPELLHDGVREFVPLVERGDLVAELGLRERAGDLADLLLLGAQLEVHAQTAARMCSRTKRTMSWVEVPGVKSSFTPIALSAAMSSGGMIPPPKTAMSPAPCSVSRS